MSEEKLSSSQLNALRQKAAQGIPLSTEEIAQFVRATRTSYLAAPKPKGKKEKAPPTPEGEIDFF